MLVCELISFEVHSVKIKLHGTKILDKMYSASEMRTMYKFRRGNCVTDCLTFLFLFSRNSKRQTPGIDEVVSTISRRCVKVPSCGLTPGYPPDWELCFSAHFSGWMQTPQQEPVRSYRMAASKNGREPYLRVSSTSTKHPPSNCNRSRKENWSQLRAGICHSGYTSLPHSIQNEGINKWPMHLLPLSRKESLKYMVDA